MKLRPNLMELERRETPTAVVIVNTNHSTPHGPPPHVPPVPVLTIGPSAEPEIMECDWRINMPGGNGP